MTVVRNILKLFSTCKYGNKTVLNQVGFYSMTIHTFAIQASLQAKLNFVV